MLPQITGTIVRVNMSIIFFFLFRTVSTLHALVVSPISLYIFLFDEGVNEDLIW